MQSLFDANEERVAKMRTVLKRKEDQAEQCRHLAETAIFKHAIRADQK